MIATVVTRCRAAVKAAPGRNVERAIRIAVLAKGVLG
jgi:hypothetical protein